MKNKNLLHICLMVVFSIFLFINTSSAQTKWQLGGQSISGSDSNKIGTTNCNRLKIIAKNIKMMEFIPKCGGSVSSQIAITNTEIFNISASETVYLPGSGTIYTKLPVSAKAKGLLNGASTACRLGIATYPYTSDATLDIIDSPRTAKAIISVESVTPVFANANCFGIKSKAFTQGGYGYGINAEGGRYGVFGKASGGAYGDSTLVSGLYGLSTGSAGLRAGIYADASGSGSSANFGIFATVDSVGPNVAGYFNGDINHTGIITGPSDLKLKEDIRPYTDALQQINKLQVKNYTYKKEFDFMNLPDGNQIGLVAQDLEKIFPNLVTERIHPKKFDPETFETTGEVVRYKAVNYLGLVPVLVEAVKEQQTQIAALTEEITTIKNQLAALLSQNQNDIYTQEIRLNSNVAKLFQNKPNPSNENTVIEYFLPENSGKALINIYTQDNKLITSCSLNHKGNGQVSINHNKFDAGIYNYELVIDGNTIDRKQMVLIR